MDGFATGGSTPAGAPPAGRERIVARRRGRGRLALLGALAATGAWGSLACSVRQPLPDPEEELIARGERIFFEETFDGNGRTCGSCHAFESDTALDPTFVASLPDHAVRLLPRTRWRKPIPYRPSTHPFWQ